MDPHHLESKPMSQTSREHAASRSTKIVLRRRLRVTWAVCSVVLLESLILGLAVLPAIALWNMLYHWERVPEWAQVVFLAMAFVPAYVLFVLGVLLYSALAARLFGWRTRPGLNVRLSDYSWDVLNWGRYLITIHVVRLFGGAVFRSTPIWVLYLRLNGAEIGRGVWVNSLRLMDHSLLHFGDRVVIGSDACVSGHIIEGGMLKTAAVHIGAGTTIGINTVVGIGAHIGEQTEVGALSVVPKFAQLEAHAVYAGAPVQKLERSQRAAPDRASNQ